MGAKTRFFAVRVDARTRANVEGWCRKKYGRTISSLIQKLLNQFFADDTEPEPDNVQPVRLFFSRMPDGTVQVCDDPSDDGG